MTPTRRTLSPYVADSCALLAVADHLAPQNDEPDWERQVLCTTPMPVPLNAHRLDDMTRGFRAYMDGKLTLAPLENPKKILEIGYVASMSLPTSLLHAELLPALDLAHGMS